MVPAYVSENNGDGEDGKMRVLTGSLSSYFFTQTHLVIDSQCCRRGDVRTGPTQDTSDLFLTDIISISSLRLLQTQHFEFPSPRACSPTPPSSLPK